jgi:hypothetical protein
MKQVYQIGFEKIDSFGDQHFSLSIDGKIEHYMFHEGAHLDVEKFCNVLREEINKEFHYENK